MSEAFKERLIYYWVTCVVDKRHLVSLLYQCTCLHSVYHCMYVHLYVCVCVWGILPGLQYANNLRELIEILNQVSII